MLKLKLQYFVHLMRRADSFEKTLMLGRIGGRRRLPGGTPVAWETLQCPRRYSWEGLMLKLQYFGPLMGRADSLEKTLMLGRLKAGGEGDDRGWDVWMASRTRWTWVWASSGRWWRTGRPGVLQSMGLQQVGHRATELTDRDSGKSWFKNQSIDSKMKTTHWFQQLCGCLRDEENVQALRGKKEWLLMAQQHWKLTFQVKGSQKIMDWHL